MMLFPILFFLCSVGAATEDIQTQDTPPSLPSSFFWGDHGGHNYLTRIQNEHAPHYCKASWALSTVAALSDRLKISRRGEGPDVVLSSQVLLNCAAVGGCSDGDPVNALQYIKEAGIPDETCQNYEGKEGICNPEGICQDCLHGNDTIGWVEGSHCVAIEKFRKFALKEYKVLDASSLQLTTSMVTTMMEEISSNGPITCAISPSPEFSSYTGGVVSNAEQPSTDLHYVNIVGWDVSVKHKYWIGRNCWGESWGNGGFVKIQMGTNALGIESKCFWGTPYLLDNPESENGRDDELEDRGLFRVRKNRLQRPPCRCALRPEDYDPVHTLSDLEATNLEIPASYDIRDIGGKSYATLDKNQHIPHYCGSCWAFASVSALADRFALLYGQAPPLIDLATQVVINCEKWMSHGCRGGWAAGAYEYIKDYGIPHETCAPYQAVDQECTAHNTCKQCLENGACTAIPEEGYRHFGVERHGTVIGEENMKREILTGGPIACSISCPSEFHAYAGGIFNATSCPPDTGDHVVEVAGWGEENGLHYWIIRNSWGTYWGEKGWIRMLMGPCDLGLTRMGCSWAVPKPFNETLPFQSFGHEA